jgi:hypothetical protein
MLLTFSSSAFVLSGIAVLCSGQESIRLLANSRGIDQPDFRYVAWDGINDAQQVLAGTGLDYTEDTWNVPGTADVELLAFVSLTPENQIAALALGFSEEVWDCYINHYDDFTWAELATEGVQQYFIILGWSENSWTGATDPPESDDFFFDELSSEEKTAAEEICYFELLWNGESLDTSGGSTASTTVVLAAAIGTAVAGIFFM